MQLYTKILIGMGVGVTLGLLVGPNSAILPADGVALKSQAIVRSAPAADAPVDALAQGVSRASIVEVRDDGWASIQFRLRAPDLLRLRKAGVSEAEGIKPGKTLQAWVNLDSPGVARVSRWGEILVAGTEWLGELFLSLIQTVVVPLVFFSLTVGVASLGDVRRLGRMGGRTLLLFTGTTVLALSIGVGLANVAGPGRYLAEDDRAELLSSYQAEASETVSAAADGDSTLEERKPPENPMVGFVQQIVPRNPVKSLAQGEMLQVIFFAFMFGIALSLLPEARSQPVVSLLDQANEAVVMLVHIAMKLAPVGVAALLFKVVGTTGFSVLIALALYGLVVLLGLLVHLALTYGSLVRVGARLRFFSFLKALRPALLLAFSTSSSSATLPVTKECVEDNINVSNKVSSFVLPLGATVNMDGTALYQGVAALFIAQIYGLDLGFLDQVTIVVSATLASVGAAGVPGAGMITLAMVLTAVGVPTEGLALVLGVDRLLDMFRTATNVVGDATATVLIARLEGEPLEFLSREADASDPGRGFEGRLREGPHPVAPKPSP